MSRFFNSLDQSINIEELKWISFFFYSCDQPIQRVERKRIRFFYFLYQPL